MVDGMASASSECYITSVPGTYQLVPLFRRKGETMWCRAADYDHGSTDWEWLYEVKTPAPDDLPASVSYTHLTLPTNREV